MKKQTIAISVLALGVISFSASAQNNMISPVPAKLRLVEE
jgi:hypothetical protein